MIWTDPIDAALRRYKSAGRSYTEIAKLLTDDFALDPKLTRNAICGRVMRLGLSVPFGKVNAQRAQIRRQRDDQRKIDIERRAREKEAQDAVKKVKPRREVAPGISVEEARAYDAGREVVPFMAWDGSGCAYIIGDPHEEGSGYCGAEKAHGPYCAHHARRVYAGSKMRPVSIDVKRLEDLAGGSRLERQIGELTHENGA